MSDVLFDIIRLQKRLEIEARRLEDLITDMVDTQKFKKKVFEQLKKENP